MTTAARISALLVLLVLAACSGKHDLSADLDKVRTAEHLPALGMRVWQHGAVVAQAMTGVRKEGAPAPATLDDQWHLGSDTKAMTATLVGLYVDRGALHWDDTLGKIFSGEKIDPQLANVTITQLLQHRGGLPHDPPHDARHGTRAEYVRAVLAAPPTQPIGKFEYSNAGYVLLGAALERITGLTWEELIQHGLFTPLAMTSCGFGAPTGDQPWGHLVTPVEPGPDADNPPAMGPAGSVHCSLADWGKFLETQVTGKVPGMTDATFKYLHTPPAIDREHYMGGWDIRPFWNGELAYAHEGSNNRWHAIAIVFPGRGEVIEIVSNRFNSGLLMAMKPLIDRYL